MTIRLRSYQDTDREEVRRFCCETGFLGNPIDDIYRDHELFADLFLNAYLDYEPEWSGWSKARAGWPATSPAR